MTSNPRAAARKLGETGRRPVIPDYELHRVIGSGSYGDVWLAQGVTGIFRAVKVVWRERFESAEPFDREFVGLTEFAAISLETQGQMALLHVGRNDDAGFFYYVMELADDAHGGRTFDPASYRPLTLKEWRTRCGRIAAADVIAIGADLAVALAGLHARGLVHRDIKPSNVILVNGRAKLADIGLVTAGGQGGTYIGTAGYVPPEGPGTSGGDVFALGRMLYELATGFDPDEFPRLPVDLGAEDDREALFALNEIVLRAGTADRRERYADASALAADFAALRARRKRPGRSRGLRVAGLTAAILAAVAAYSWRSRNEVADSVAASEPVSQSTGAPGAPSEIAARSANSLVVLPFTNSSGDPADEYFADGVSEELLNLLGRVSGLKVAGRTSAFHFKGRNVPLAEVAHRLGVAYVVEGSVRRSGDRVRITVQLASASSGFQLWSDTFTRDLKDIFAVQEEIAALIAQRLQLRLARSGGVAPVQPHAYRLYLEGRREWNQRNPQAFARAEDLFSKALALDQDFARAWVGLADVGLLRRGAGWRAARSGDELERIEQALSRALALDDTLAEAHATRGYLLSEDRATWAAAETAFQRALELNPSYASAHQWYGRLHSERGAFDRAVAELELAALLDPLSAIIHSNHGLVLLNARRHREALAASERALGLHPELEQALLVRARALLELGERDSAAQIFRALMGRSSRFSSAKFGSRYLAAHLARAGYPDEAATALHVQADDQRNWWGVETALLLVALGRTDEGLVQLERDADGIGINPLLSPIFDSVRSSPRFGRVVENFGLAEAYARAWKSMGNE